MQKLMTRIAAGAALVLPFVAFAQNNFVGNVTPVNPIGDPVSGAFDILDIIDTVVTWAFGLLLVLAAIFIIWAGFLYLTSGGDEEKTKKAKNFLVYAVVAIVIAALARGIVFIVRQLLGVRG